MNYNRLSKFFTGELTSDEKKSLLDSLESGEEYLEEAAKLKNSWAAAQLSFAPSDDETARKAWKKFYASIIRQRRLTLTRWQVAAAAAIVVFTVAASFFAGYLVNKEPANMAYHTLSVPAGQYAQLTLADGSEIWLNSCSKIVYPERFSSATREIWLEGEGFFKVMSEIKQPFVVKTEIMDIIATGTKFNVSVYNDDSMVSVALIEGNVKLFSETENINYDMKTGQIAVYDMPEHSISIQGADTGMYTSWINGEYQFRETALAEIAKRLTRYSNVTFVIDDEDLKQRKFTGTFHSRQSVENIMQVITTSGRIKYTMKNDTVYIK